MTQHEKLIKILIKYGIRKRLKRSEVGTLENWMSISDENRKIADDLRNPARQADIAKELALATSSECWKEICRQMGWEPKTSRSIWG
jgi:hypothetical protein